MNETLYWTWYNGSGKPTTYPFQVLHYDQKIGRNNPRWTELVKAGKDAGSPYTRTLNPSDYDGTPISWEWTRWKDGSKSSYWTYLLSGDYPLQRTLGRLMNFAVPDVDDLKSRAKIAFLGQIRDATQDFQTFPFLGELKETIGMIRNPLRGLTRNSAQYQARVLRRLPRLKKAGAVADFLSDQYLQWTYGVSPLINDIKGIQEAVANILSKSDKQLADIPVRVTLMDRIYGSEPYYRFTSTTMSYIQTHHLIGQASVRIQGMIRQDLDSPLRHVRAKLGIELSEFVPTVWELMPYSFLIDYVTNVGDLLGAAVTATRALRWYWRSTRVTRTRLHMFVPMPTTGYARSWPMLPAVAWYSKLDFNRDKPGLTVSFRDFRFKDPTAKQEANAAVLAFTKLRQKNKSFYFR